MHRVYSRRLRNLASSLFTPTRGTKFSQNRGAPPKNARRRHQEVGGDLADVLLHRLRTLWTVDAETDHQRRRQRPEGVANPRWREIGQGLVGTLIRLHLAHPLDGGNEVRV